MTFRGAISALGTRVSFLVVAWLVLSGGFSLRDTAIVAGAQLLSYIIFRLVAQLIRPMLITANLLSIGVVIAMAFYLSNVVVLASLAAGLALLRGFSDRTLPPPAPKPERPPRTTLTTIVLFLVGVVIGGVAFYFGPVGALWANAMLFAAAAGAVAVSTYPYFSRTKVIDGAIDGPTMQLPTIGDLPANPLARKLALTLFTTNLFVQAGAVFVVVFWAQRIIGQPQMLGIIAAAFMVGLLAGGVTFAGLTRRTAPSVGLALGAVAGGAGAYLYFLDRPPVLLLVVGAALMTGVATASVMPLTGTLLSEHIPAALRSKVDALLATVSYLGVPAGTVAAAWYLPKAAPLTGLGAAAGTYLVAILIPIFVFRSWRMLLPENSADLMGSGTRLPARLTVTLAYANGQWIVEVRRGRALLGNRHLVKSNEAMNMLAVLDVPGVQDSVEKALSIDQIEATRQAERMRGELAELEARLAGLAEMVEITEAHKPSHTPTHRATYPVAPKQREPEDRDEEEEVAK